MIGAQYLHNNTTNNKRNKIKENATEKHEFLNVFGVELKSMNAHSKERERKKNVEGLYCMIQSDSMERSLAEKNILQESNKSHIISFNTIFVFNVHVKNWMKLEQEEKKILKF